MSVTDIKAAQIWRTFPKEIQRRFLSNVFCGKCGATTIVDYTIHNEKLGIVLKGNCKSCAGNVARFIETDDWTEEE